MMTNAQLGHLLQYAPDENNRIFMPNEIFVDLPGTFFDARKIGFTFSFIYLTTYLYRFAKYGGVNGSRYQIGKLKEILGYANNSKSVNEIIKAGGVLDVIGYTRSTTDMPLHVCYGTPGELENYGDVENYDLNFSLWSDLDNDMKSWLCKEGHKPYPIKYPVKAFEREPEMTPLYSPLGTFYCIENTTCIPVAVFLYCMSNDDLGVVAFWLYSFMKYKHEYFGREFVMVLPRFSKESGISKATLVEYLKTLESRNMIGVKRRKNPGTKAHDSNLLSVKNWEKFAPSKDVAIV